MHRRQPHYRDDFSRRRGGDEFAVRPIRAKARRHNGFTSETIFQSRHHDCHWFGKSVAPNGAILTESRLLARPNFRLVISSRSPSKILVQAKLASGSFSDDFGFQNQSPLPRRLVQNNLPASLCKVVAGRPLKKSKQHGDFFNGEEWRLVLEP